MVTDRMVWKSIYQEGLKLNKIIFLNIHKTKSI